VPRPDAAALVSNESTWSASMLSLSLRIMSLLVGR
jgi:hypothetical protein